MRHCFTELPTLSLFNTHEHPSLSVRVISWQEAESPEKENISGLRFLLERRRIISASITTKLPQFCSSLDNTLEETDLSQHQLLINTSLSSGAITLWETLFSFPLHQVFRDLCVSWSQNSDRQTQTTSCRRYVTSNMDVVIKPSDIIHPPTPDTHTPQNVYTICFSSFIEVRVVVSFFSLSSPRGLHVVQVKSGSNDELFKF